MDTAIVLVAILAVGFTAYALGFNPVDILTKLSANQIAQVAQNAGFTGGDLTIAVAVALAESGGNPKAHGDTTLGSGTGSFGLWQIYSDAHPEYGPDFTQLYDPQTNANAAYAIYQQAGFQFTPWSTFKNGAYEAHLDDASAGVNA